MPPPTAASAGGAGRDRNRAAAQRRPPTPAQRRERRLERAISARNDPDAMLSLSELLQRGAPGVRSDPSRALQLLQRAATQHRSAATLHRLAAAHWQQPPPPSVAPRPRRFALDLLQQSIALSETPRALCDCAWLLVDANGTPEIHDDPHRAVQLLQRAVTRFDSAPAECFHNLAYLLASDQLSQPDPVAAVAHYKRAIKLSHDPRTMINLAILYQYGRPPLKPNPRKAQIWYERVLTHGDFPYAQYHLAVILASSNRASHLLRAAKLLDNAISQIDCEAALLLSASLHSTKRSVLNHAKAVRLLRAAISQFDSTDAMESLCYILLSGRPGVPCNPCEAFRLITAFHDRTKITYTRALLAELHWSGTASHRANRVRAVQLCQKSLHKVPVTYTTLASMHRYGHGKQLNQSLNLALQLLEHIQCSPGDFLYVWKNMMLAIVLSEVQHPYALLLHRVFCMFKEGVDSTDDDYWWFWLPLHLRQSSIALPVCGCPHRITHAVMKEEELRVVSILNLSSLLLEKHIILPENKDVPTALSLLESGVSKYNNDLVRINLAYVLWYGVSGVHKDPSRAIQLVEGVMARSSHQLARTLLACMLAERQRDGDVPRAVELWKQVTRSLRDVEEVDRLCMLISPKAEKPIVEYSQQPLLRHHRRQGT
ncbi:hypothetical protein BWQ96_06728 [Gracilariopsis chorda]|uniref:Uncharacterized protein n=1 Tax=Gracilariopsis chorda TaxID=448386 RepID=A0A2V3IN89_9FLOR|nr:hypothetical protein BWQ96_06728 [Gracilariopsis chorda]|eukprot:PXF43527.1 hypothetical protein BWQ96_06728 [Gracilariopsis chorda]